MTDFAQYEESCGAGMLQMLRFLGAPTIEGMAMAGQVSRRYLMATTAC